MLQTAIVGKQQQPFTVVVQPPHRIDLRNRNKILERPAALVIPKLAQHPVRLVKQEITIRHALQLSDLAQEYSPLRPRNRRDIGRTTVNPFRR